MKQKKRAAALSMALAMLAGLSACDQKQKGVESVSYNWGNVAIGGGGYVTGITYNPTEEGPTAGSPGTENGCASPTTWGA